MRETPPALAAFEAYFGLGDGRSLEKLCARYQTAPEAAPTTRLATLKQWSANFGWQARLADRIAAEAAAAAAEKSRRLAEVEALLLHDAIEAQRLVMRELQALAASGEIGGRNLAPLLAWAQGAMLRALRQPATIARTEQTGQGGGPIEAAIRHERDFDFDAYARLFLAAATPPATAVAGAGAAGDDDPAESVAAA